MTVESPERTEPIEVISLPGNHSNRTNEPPGAICVHKVKGRCPVLTLRRAVFWSCTQVWLDVVDFGVRGGLPSVSSPVLGHTLVTVAAFFTALDSRHDIALCLGGLSFGRTGVCLRALPGTQQSDTKRQHLLERLLDAVKQCQIRFGGRKEIATDSDSRVICLCAQFEAVLQHGLRKSRGLALTAAALKQAAGFSSKAEAELTFWFYVKEHLNRHELQRFYSLRQISSELGRGRAWLRCALNEHSLERYLHTLLADRPRLGTYYEDWAFTLDEERASMLPTMAAGLNSILFAINIDNSDLNGGVARGGGGPSVSHLLKESTQGIGSLWKESTQGVSSLLREIGTATAAVPGFNPRVGGASDPLPVLPRSASTESGLRKERRRRKKITNIISFDDDLDGGVEDEEEGEECSQKLGVLRKSHTAPAQSSVEEGIDPFFSELPAQNGIAEPPVVSWVGSPHHSRTPSAATPPLPDSKSIDDEEEEDEDEEMYKPRAQAQEEERIGSDQVVVGSLSSVSSWSPPRGVTVHSSADILIPVNPADPQTASVSSVEDASAFPARCETAGLVGNCESSASLLTFSMESSPSTQTAPLSSVLKTSGLPESMTVVELRQAIMAMMNRKDELEEQNTSLRSLLDGEMEHSAGLRLESDLLKKKLAELEERHTAKVQALARENEVLKVQLKKYVGAVQMLKREGSQDNDALSMMQSSEDQIPVPQNKFMGDVEELASSYERKLIEVAEMHGELIEFNERLYCSLMAKDHLIVQMRQELIDLRGPVPGDLSQTSDDPNLSDFETAHRALINVWIPSVFLQGRAANAYHVYQVYIRILDNEWNVYRRYTEFRQLHNHLRAQFPQADTFNFPPKKAIGNKDAKFVEERRKQLQGYLRMVMNKLIQTLPEFTALPTKESLLSLLPFCLDTPQANDAGTKTPRSKTSSRFPRLGRSSTQDARPEPQSGDL
ncbi:sorting nexin-29 [Brachionichthys hirsutus]|uniref:sorting nexin-29 n=1 Tax=Brachionichthys hirsutus TaxID=412623 RepID=UPI0036044069